MSFAFLADLHFFHDLSSRATVQYFAAYEPLRMLRGV
jgi:hypothetical protein